MKRKKIIFLSICILLVGGMIAFGIVTYPKPLVYDFDSIEAIESDVVLLSEEDPLNHSGSPALAKVKDGAISTEPFKVLFLTDVHLCELKEPTTATIDRFVKWIESEKPDLIILGGDTLNGLFDSQRVTQFRDLMDRFGVYWAPVLGNHEGDRPTFMTKRKKLVRLWSESPLCLMESDEKHTKEGALVDGYGNYVVSILGTEGRITDAFFMMDNGSKLMKEEEYEKWGVKKKADTAISASQVTWYRETYQEMKEKNGGTLTHMCVIHKPLQEFAAAISLPNEDAIEYGKVITDWSLTEEALAKGWQVIDGDLRDKIHCPPYTDGKLYDALRELGAKAVFFGHDHVNDLTLYDANADFYMTYIRLTTVTEEVPDAEGYNILLLGADGSYSYTAYLSDGKKDIELFSLAR